MAELHNDIGHGINTYPPNKGVPGMAEFEFNNAVGKETKRLLKGKVNTFEAQPFDGRDIALITRTNQYNARWAKDKTSIGISNHANANGKKDVRGFGVFYWHTSPEAKKLAEIILDEYKKEFPGYPIWGTGLFPSVPNTWTNFHMCRETKGVFVLVEWEFMTNPDALKLLKSNDYRKRCALVNAKSVCRWYGIKWSEDKNPSQPAPKPITPNQKPAQAQPKPSGAYTGGSIVDYLNSIGVDSSAANRRKLAKEYGVSNYDLSATKNLELLNKMRNGKTATKPASKPAASPKPAAKKQTVHLPASAKTWRTYKLNVQPVKKNSDWSLTPSAFGGLTYDILGNPYSNVVTIMTGRGKRNIYVGPETGAVIK
ncbi:hypothetical protein J22TS1_43620 [Siminovitchia terrae]|uniref:N-acetylmuramoyl-L-alanine amidase n=1 Tax=Siminovitchia terrae TaxID=1914933 RepID=UPI001B1E3F04|nr:N-acetylmuramoyl-L-alanine amidase [Siminovitchia terrae]GIN93311.1 hypothetical protein J22TS1_43620 [Siminovitchia terrae]